MIERSVMVIIPYIQIELLFLDKLPIQLGSPLALRNKHEEESNNQDWDNESKNEIHLSIFIKEIKSYPQILWKTIG